MITRRSRAVIIKSPMTVRDRISREQDPAEPEPRNNNSAVDDDDQTK
jgi:hypothetical protein